MRNQALGSIYKNSFLVLVGKSVFLVTGILIVPLIISYLGIEDFGFWEIILAVSTLFVTFQSSITYSILWKISEYYNDPSIKQAKRWYQIGLFFITVQNLVAGIILFVFLDRIFSMVFSENINLFYKNILQYAILATLFNSYSEVIANLLNAFQFSGLTSILKAISQTIGYILTFFLLTFDYGLESLLYGYLVNVLLYFLFLYYLMSSRVGIRTVCLKIPSKKEISVIISYLKNMMVGSVAVLFRNQIIKIFLSIFASVTWVGLFGIAQRLSQLILFIVNFITIPTISSIGALWTKTDFKEIKRMFSDLNEMLLFVNGFISILIIGASESILTLWLGNFDPQLVEIITIIIVAQYYSVSLTALPASFCKGIGIVYIETKYILFNVFLYILTIYPSYLVLGPVGIIVSSSGSWLISSVYFFYLFQSETKLTQKFKKIITVLVAQSFFLVLFRFLYKIINLNYLSSFRLIIHLLIISIVSFVAYYLTMYLVKSVPKIFLFRRKVG